VDIGRRADHTPSYYIVPDEDFATVRPGRAVGASPKSPKSVPPAVKRGQLGEWANRWEYLGIFGDKAP
jgi:hypothetical protein